MSVRRFVLRTISDTPFEHILRKTSAKISLTKGAKYDRQTLKILKQVLRSKSNCIDVGCYRGEILREIIKFAPYGMHFSFEPVSENYQYLIKQFKSVNVLNIALSDYSGQYYSY